MNKNYKTVKTMTAPKVDNQILQATHQCEVRDICTKGLVMSLFHKLQAIEACGDDERREIWLTAPRGSIKDFGKYEEYLEEGEVESREEFEALWLSYYPDTQKWYLLTTVVYREYYSVFIDGKPGLEIKPDDEGQYSHDKSKLIYWLIDKVDETIASLKSGSYNEYVRMNLPYCKRFGKILRKDFWNIFTEEKEEYLKCIAPEEIEHFVSLMKKQQENDVTSRIPEMTAAMFFNTCRLGYEANEYKRAEGLTAKEMYRACADGRDEGLLDLDEVSSEAFNAWYHDRSRFGGHPWEVCRGGNSTHISLYVCNDENGWWFVLAGSSYGRSVETVKFYLAIEAKGLPVFLRDGPGIAAMLTGSDYIGIVPDRIFPRYCASLFPDEAMLDFMNLPHENREQVEKAAFWYPLPEARLSSTMITDTITET